jgi:hypothetical protein
LAGDVVSLTLSNRQNQSIARQRAPTGFVRTGFMRGYSGS